VIRLKCPRCEKVLSVSEAHAGKKGKCPGCGSVFFVPAPAGSGIQTRAPAGPRSVTLPPARRPLNVYAFFALGFAVLALPLAAGFKTPILGVGVAAMSLVFVIFSLVLCLSQRGARMGFVGVTLAVCGSVSVTAVLFAGGFEGIGRTIHDRFARAGRSEQQVTENSGPKRSPAKVPTDQLDDNLRLPPTQAPAEQPEEKPPPKVQPEERPQPKEEDPAARKAAVLRRLLASLGSNVPADRIAAANQLAKMGADAEPACTALCEAALDPIADVRAATLEALEKIRPSLHKPLVTLLVDEQPFQHQQALESLRTMGRSASPCLPVLLAYARWNLQRGKGVKGGAFNQQGGTFNLRFPGTNGDLALHAIAAIAPDDPGALKLFREMATCPPDAPNALQVRVDAVSFLGEAGRVNPKTRAESVPVLVSALSLTYFNSPDISTCRAAIKTLGEFGADAREVLPALKKLKLHPDAGVREDAASVVAQLEQAK
jgi:phage FluMu protein Com